MREELHSSSGARGRKNTSGQSIGSSRLFDLVQTAYTAVHDNPGRRLRESSEQGRPEGCAGQIARVRAGRRAHSSCRGFDSLEFEQVQLVKKSEPVLMILHN